MFDYLSIFTLAYIVATFLERRYFLLLVLMAMDFVGKKAYTLEGTCLILHLIQGKEYIREFPVMKGSVVEACC